MSALVEKIKSRGYWRVLVRPTSFKKDRLPNISDLFSVVQRASVELRGWDFPHIDVESPPHIDMAWVGQESEFSNYLEAWRLYQTGQFADFSGIPDDWLDQAMWGTTPEKWKPGLTLGIGEATYRFTELFEFGSRLSLTAAGDDVMHIEVAIFGLEGRHLVVDDPRRSPLSRPRTASIQQWPYEIDVPRQQLLADARELALQAATELFRRFGYDPRAELLRELQAKLRR